MGRIARTLPRPVRQRLKRLGGIVGSGAPVRPRSPAEITIATIGNLAPLAVEQVSGRRPMVNVVTDTIAAGYMFGGVGTAALLAATIARHSGRGLRFVTRAHVPVTCEPVYRLLALHGVEHGGPIETLFSPEAAAAPMPLGPDDLVMTTSWWTTHAARNTVPRQQMLYLLQEDERMFYAGGDQHLLCDEVLQDESIRSIVNTPLLLDHFRATSTRGPARRGIAFEPAFPASIYHPAPVDGRRKLLFYARPGHPRNLFLRGLAALEQAIADGLFAPDEWEIHFAGVGIPPVELGGRSIQYHDTVSWPDYAALVRRCDLGLSLMYTPHPSYPPLDMAASGAVVVTNAFGVKQDLSALCGNILTVPVSVDGLVDGLHRGAALAVDLPRRRRHHAEATIARHWQDSFAPVLQQLGLA